MKLIDILYFIKIKNFCTSKGTTKKMKRQAMVRRKHDGNVQQQELSFSVGRSLKLLQTL